MKAMLLRIYQYKKPFELMVIDKKPKTRMGWYVVDSQRRRTYCKYRSEWPLEEIAIHEYAHHIHHTEQYSNDYRRRDRSHGEKFWRIYSVLRAKAQKLGVFDDELVSDIIK